MATKYDSMTPDQLIDLTLFGDVNAAAQLKKHFAGHSAGRNPLSATNAGRRMKGSLMGPTVRKETNGRLRLPPNPPRDPQMVSHSTFRLVEMAKGGDRLALEELKIRGRDTDGVRLAWKAGENTAAGAAMGRVQQKFATGRGILLPAWKHPTHGPRTNPFGFGGDDDEG